MININQKVKDRYVKGIRKYKKVLEKATLADINESDTVTIIVDMLNDIFGYDKYENITSEYAIKKTFCDLAIKIDGTLKLLIECKAIGLNLKQDFIRQATNYAANEGVEWVLLTNGVKWQIYNIIFAQPVENKLIAEFDFTELSSKNSSDLDLLYFLSIECNKKNSKTTLQDLKEQKSIMNRYFIGQLLLEDTLSDCIRKQLRKLCPDLKISNQEVTDIISSGIIKREIIESDDAEDAKKRMIKLVRSSQKKIKKKEEVEA